MEKIVEGYRVTAKKWEGYGKKRMYFTIDFPPHAGSGKHNQACWDYDKREFVKCERLMDAHFPNRNHLEAMEQALKEAFNL